MFDCEIKYKKDSTNVEADMLLQIPVSGNISHHVHLPDLNEVKEVLKKEKLMINDKKNY